MTTAYEYAKDTRGALYRKAPFRNSFSIEMRMPHSHTWHPCDPVMRIRNEAGEIVKVMELEWREEPS